MDFDEATKPQPFDFGRGIFLPFQSGPQSLSYVLKSAFFYAIVGVILFAFFGGLITEPYMEIIKLSVDSDVQPSDAEIMGTMFSFIGKLLLGFLIIGLGMWVCWAMIEAALHRRVLLGERKTGFFPWKFGMDEVWVMACQLINYLIYQALYFVSYIVIIIGVVIAAMVGSSNITLGVIFGVIIAVLALFCIAGAIWVLMRLAPLAALTTVRKDLAISEVWSIAKGKLWSMFGAYVFHYLVSGIVIYLVVILLFFLIFGSSFGDLAALGNLDSPDELWSGFSAIMAKPGVKLGLFIWGLIIYATFAVWMMCVAGIGTHIAELYLKETGELEA